MVMGTIWRSLLPWVWLNDYCQTVRTRIFTQSSPSPRPASVISLHKKTPEWMDLNITSEVNKIRRRDGRSLSPTWKRKTVVLIASFLLSVHGSWTLICVTLKEWEKCLQSPPPHCEMPVAPQLSPEVKIDYCRRTVCPALYTLHTHHFSIISIIHWGGGECVRSYSHTHTQTHIGLEALTGLLAKGQSHESDKSFFGETKTYHNQINWKDKCSYFSFLFVFPSVSEYFCVDVSLSVKMKKPV